MDGYKEAAKVDKQFNALLESEKVTPENSLEWLAFARTVRTTCLVIEEIAREKLELK